MKHLRHFFLLLELFQIRKGKQEMVKRRFLLLPIHEFWLFVVGRSRVRLMRGGCVKREYEKVIRFSSLILIPIYATWGAFPRKALKRYWFPHKSVSDKQSRGWRRATSSLKVGKADRILFTKRSRSKVARLLIKIFLTAFEVLSWWRQSSP